MIKSIKYWINRLLNLFSHTNTEDVLNELNGEKSLAQIAYDTANNRNKQSIDEQVENIIYMVGKDIKNASENGKFYCQRTLFLNFSHELKKEIKKYYRKNKFSVYITPLKMHNCKIKISWKRVR